MATLQMAALQLVQKPPPQSHNWFGWIATFVLNGAGVAVSNGPWEVSGALFVLGIPCTVTSCLLLYRSANGIVERTVAVLTMISALAFTFWIADRVIKFPVDFSARAQRAFIEDLKGIKEKPELVLLSCSSTNTATCAFAERFIPVFQRAGWSIEGPLARPVALGRNVEDILIADYGPPLIHPQNPDEGVWTRIMPWRYPETAAFKKLGITVIGISDPELPVTRTRVYFGSVPTRTLIQIIRSWLA